MNKTGNSHSNLIESLTKAAESKKIEADNNSKNLADQILEGLKPQSEGPTLKEIIAQLMLNNEMDDTVPAEAAPVETTDSGDSNSVKEFISKALVELCGGVDQAIQCLQTSNPGEDSIPAIDNDVPAMADDMPKPMPEPTPEPSKGNWANQMIDTMFPDKNNMG